MKMVQIKHKQLICFLDSSNQARKFSPFLAAIADPNIKTDNFRIGTLQNLPYQVSKESNFQIGKSES